MFNTSKIIYPLLEQIIINSYDLSLKLGPDNLEDSIVKCISGKTFRDVNGKTCNDYKEICKDTDAIMNMSSELRSLIKEKE